MSGDSGNKFTGAQEVTFPAVTGMGIGANPKSHHYS